MDIQYIISQSKAKRRKRLPGDLLDFLIGGIKKMAAGDGVGR